MHFQKSSCKDFPKPHYMKNMTRAYQCQEVAAGKRVKSPYSLDPFITVIQHILVCETKYHNQIYQVS